LKKEKGEGRNYRKNVGKWEERDEEKEQKRQITVCRNKRIK
jgi:hypothetical protein